MTYAYISRGEHDIIKVWLSPECTLFYDGEYTNRNINKTITDVVKCHFNEDPTSVHFIVDPSGLEK